MANKRSRNKSTRANPSSAQQEPDTGVSAACAKPVALQADPSPLSAQLLTAQTAATSMERTWASLFKPAAYVASPSVANTTAAPAPAQRLYAECLLKEFLEDCYKWNKEQFKRGCQNILGSLIGKVAHLGLKGVTQGRLTGENILVIGNEAENLQVEILGTPQKYNRALPSYREQFRTLASKMVDAWDATCPLASKHFLKMLEYCIPWFCFKQLQWHPLLLSSHEVAEVIFRLYTHLDVGKKGWKNNYKELITRENVDFGKIISGTGRGAFAFSKKSEIQLLLQKPEEIPADALLTPEEIENTLAQAFPEVPLELFNYMLYKRIDINTTIT